MFHYRAIRSATVPSGGFTLMELMVASALMAAVMAGLWGLINIFVGLSQRGVEEFEQLNRSTAVFRWLESDLRSVPGVVDAAGEPVLWGNERELNLLCVAPPSLHWLGRVETDPRWFEAELAPGQFDASPRVPATVDPTSGHASVNATPGVAAGRSSPPSPGLAPPFGPARSFDLDPYRDEGAGLGGAGLGDNGQGAERWAPAVRRIRYRLDAAYDVPDRSANVDSPRPQRAAFDDLVPGGDPPEQQFWRYEQYATTSSGDRLQAAWQFPRVEAVRLSYYDGEQWHGRWDSSRRRKLPRAIRLETWYLDGSPLAPPDGELSLEDDAPATPPLPDATIPEQPVDESSTIASSWTSAFAPLDSTYLPQRPADLTHWISLE